MEGLAREEFAQLPQTNSMLYRAVKNAIVKAGEAIKALPRELRERRDEVN